MIGLGCDHGGYELMQEGKKHLDKRGIPYQDFGCYSRDSVDYPDYARQVGHAVQEGSCEKGILICGTGMGMAIVANKYPGVYAAVCENTYAAEKCRAINDANILTMGGWITADFAGCAIVDKFLNTAFTENLEPWRQEFLTKAREEVKGIEKGIYHN